MSSMEVFIYSVALLFLISWTIYFIVHVTPVREFIPNTAKNTTIPTCFQNSTDYCEDNNDTSKNLTEPLQ